MIIEYRVWDARDGSIFPFTPQWRRKLQWPWVPFQFFYGWNNFADYDGYGELTTRRRFSDFGRAAAFLKEVKSPWDYYEDLEASRPAPKNHCHYEKEY